MKSLLFFFGVMFSSLCSIANTDTLIVRSTTDFQTDGKGSAPNWESAEWVNLQQLDTGSHEYRTRFRILYSGTGIYVLFEGMDRKITSTYKKDFTNMFNADVFEVFFHTDPSLPLYFEYEVNAYNKELVLLIPNIEGRLMGWVPWHYDGDRKVRKKVHVHKRNGKMEKWTAELFFPYGLLSPLNRVPAQKGMHWNANFYRLDYDDGRMVKLAWRPVEKSFHEYRKFGVIRFD